MRPRAAPSDPCTKFSSRACSSPIILPGPDDVLSFILWFCHQRGSVLTEKAAEANKKERLLLGGMARWDGLDLFGPTYMSVAYRHRGKIHVRVEPSSIWKPRNPTVQRLSRLPVLRSIFFWGRLILQVVGSIWTLVFFAAMKFTPIGRYHGAEHKAVAAYEEHGEVTLEGARKSSRIHPRCGTNILSYIILAALLDPLIGWWGYAIVQFILISQAWFIFGRTRPSIAVGDFLQRYFTTPDPRRAELEVAVESLNRLLRAEDDHTGVGKLTQIPARF